MKRIPVMMCVLLLITAFPLYAKDLKTLEAEQTPKEHPIEAWLSACMDNDSTTVGMMQCGQKAYQLWDDELNTQYQAVRNLLNKPGKEMLKQSQKAWLVYRDAEFQTIDMLYSSLEGTMWRPVLQFQKINLVKERTLMLKSYKDDLSAR